MFAYCENNPVNNSDPDGYFAAALAGGGCLTGILATGCSNIWNPVGWILVGVALCVSIIVVAYAVKTDIYASQKYDPDPYARPNQKKQGRENKGKNRRKDNYTPRNNKRNNKPARPKKHTPAREHRRPGRR